MITITKNGNAVLFEFEENQHYLYNGTIEVPLNSLSLVTDESEMFTFKKAATNDIFISARYDDVNMSKSQLIDFYIANMVGSTGGGSESGITSGDVQTMINTSLDDYYDIDEIDAALSGKQDTLIAGSGITISGDVISAEGGNLVIELTQAEYDALVDKDPNAFYIITDATEINISDYYTSAQTQSAINAAVSGKADTSSVYTKSEVDTALSGKADTSAVTEAITAAVSGKADSTAVTQEISAAISGKADASDVETALSAKQDISGMTAYTTSSDVESYVSGFTYDKATIDSKVASGGTFDPTNYYDKTATDALLDYKFDASAFTSYSAATDARMAEDEEVTAAALNDLNDALSGKADSSAVTADITAAVSGKQDTLIAGSGITISGNVISADGGSITIDPSLDSGSTNAVANSAITNALDSKIQDIEIGKDNWVGSGVTDLRISKNSSSYKTKTFVASINNKEILTGSDYSKANKFSLIETSAITSSVTSASTDSQVPSAKAVYDALQESGGGGVSESAFTAYSAATDARMAEDEEVTAAALNALNDRFDGLRLKKLTQSEYEALTVKDNNTLYILVG